MDATKVTWTNDATQDAFDYANYPNDQAQRARLREQIKQSARLGKRGQFTRTGELKAQRGKSAAEISESMTGAVANYLRDNLVVASADVRGGSFSAYLVIAALGRIDWPQLAERLICKYLPDEYVPVP
jgi:hypothetical protein